MMSKRPENQGKPWSDTQVRQLEKLAEQNTPTRVIGLNMGRSPEAVRTKASEKRISLKPTNQSPYNRRGK